MKSNRSAFKPNQALLAVSAAGLAAWLTLDHANIYVLLCLPLSAIVFGLYLVLEMLDRQATLVHEHPHAAKVARSKESSQRTR